MKKSIIVFFVGIVIGIIIPILIAEGYNIDWENANAVDVYKTFGLVLGGYTGYLTLLVFSITIPILLVIPRIGKHIQKESKSIRFIAGASVGFGIMQLATLFVEGLPKAS